MIPSRIGISLGDPAGIGPEIVLKALASLEQIPKARYVLFGHSRLIREEEKQLGISLDIQPNEKHSSPHSPGMYLEEVEGLKFPAGKGKPSREGGDWSFRSFKKAVDAAREKSIDSLVTAPISKKSWEMAGLPWRGHTDYLRHFYPQAIMAFWSERIRVALFTSHLPLKSALELVRRERLVAFFLQLNQGIERVRPGKTTLLVAGLNPHAGEDGLLGTEEIEEIIPAIQEAQRKGVAISGPYPPDVIFRKCLDQPDTMVIALYHDQGCIPFKLEAFEKGVNITLGLPFIRTSPDHGTAYDIAGRGKASPLSMIEALKLASAFAGSSKY